MTALRPLSSSFAVRSYLRRGYAYARFDDRARVFWRFFGPFAASDRLPTPF
ncbi:hypothetical protein [Neomegalonema sp.]|uniref:hypothetical protein n=1 Tax=Neomegalonema sp. TaxID=2039713 RepID=UPI00262587D6|nr:hypothetical protein [Neomegalonema sp.]MDD2868023.1 hypothetical protein [Neomegalonema sp.]